MIKWGGRIVPRDCRAFGRAEPSEVTADKRVKTERRIPIQKTRTSSAPGLGMQGPMDPETLYNPIAAWSRTQKKPFGSCMTTHPRTVLIMRWSVDSACGLARAGDDRSRNALGQRKYLGVSASLPFSHRICTDRGSHLVPTRFRCGSIKPHRVELGDTEPMDAAEDPRLLTPSGRVVRGFFTSTIEPCACACASFRLVSS